MAKIISFGDGLVEYEINGAATVRFNPTDAAFTERLYRAFSDLDARQDEFQRTVEEIGDDGERMFAYAKERDAEMRGIIDGLLGDGVSDALFGDMNCYALADGLPVWINLMFAVAGEVDSAYDDERSKADPRVREYKARHEELLKKYRKATSKR